MLDERNTLGSQGFATIAAAFSPKQRALLGSARVEMHGITGGDDAYLCDDAAHVVEQAFKKALAKDMQQKELEKACKNALLSLLWERTKQRPMVIVNLITV